MVKCDESQFKHKSKVSVRPPGCNVIKVTANLPGLILPPNFFLPKRKVIIKANVFRKNENKISNRARVIEKKTFCK